MAEATEHPLDGEWHDNALCVRRSVRPLLNAVEPAPTPQGEPSAAQPMFAELAERSFDFLLQKGFKVVQRRAGFVRYESHTVFVNVYHGRLSYQVGVEVGRIREHDLYSLHEVLTAFAPSAAGKARYQTNDVDLLRQYLADIASTVERSCGSLLSGDVAAFKTMADSTTTSRGQAALQAQFGPVIERGDIAWESRDYKHAAEHYEAAEPALDATRRRRLEYVRRKNPKNA